MKFIAKSIYAIIYAPLILLGLAAQLIVSAVLLGWDRGAEILDNLEIY